MDIPSRKGLSLKEGLYKVFSLREDILRKSNIPQGA